MATVDRVRSSALQRVFEDTHPQWTKAFQREVRSQQLAADDEAWGAVTGILITIVTIGVILAAATVLVCLSY